MQGYADLADLPEDERIELIGKVVMDAPATSADKPRIVACCVDDEPGKAERYIEKFKAKFPGIRVIDQFKGPVPDVITIRLGPPLR